MLHYSTWMQLQCYTTLRELIYTPGTLPSTVPSLTGKDVEKANEGVRHSMEEVGTRKCLKYDYSAIKRAHIGQYAAENSPARAVCYLSKVLDKMVPEKMNNNYFPFEQTAKYNAPKFCFSSSKSMPPNKTPANISSYTVRSRATSRENMASSAAREQKRVCTAHRTHLEYLLVVPEP